MAASYNNYKVNLITASINSSSFLYVYDSVGSLKQTIVYSSSYLKAIDASKNYLVAVDSAGYLAIITYSTQPDIVITGFPVWAIVLISSCLFLLCVIGAVVMIVRARKRRLAIAAVNGYNRFNDPQPSQTYFPNNQAFNANTQPFVGANQGSQGWNANQAWIKNQNENRGFSPALPSNQGSSQPATINPYQANQPSNWS